MKSVFADSFHFLALLNEEDRSHRRALIEHRRPWQSIVTTDCVLLEVGDAFCDPRDHDDFLALYGSLQTDRRVNQAGLTRIRSDLNEI